MSVNTEQQQQQQTAEDLDGAAKVELLKLNAERKKQGLPILTEAEFNQRAKQQVKEESITLTDKGNASLSTEDQNIKREIDQKFSGFNQARIQSIFGTYQGDRIEYIARLSQQNAFEIFLFDQKNISPPEFGVEPEKESNSQQLVKKIVYYHMMPSNIYNRIKDIRDKLADLGRIEALTRGYFDENNVFQTAKMPVNDFSVTQMSDEEFAKIHQIIGNLTMEQYKLAAKWCFGIPEEMVTGESGDFIVEDNSFRTAIDAALYKEEWAIASSKKSSSFYK